MRMITCKPVVPCLALRDSYNEWHRGFIGGGSHGDGNWRFTQQNNQRERRITSDLKSTVFGRRHVNRNVLRRETNALKPIRSVTHAE
jgi:hypothetical protein